VGGAIMRSLSTLYVHDIGPDNDGGSGSTTTSASAAAGLGQRLTAQQTFQLLRWPAAALVPGAEALLSGAEAVGSGYMSDFKLMPLATRFSVCLVASRLFNFLRAHQENAACARVLATLAKEETFLGLARAAITALSYLGTAEGAVLCCRLK
jgi:hypothetical protein